MLTIEGFVKGCRDNHRRLIWLFAIVGFLIFVSTSLTILHLVMCTPKVEQQECKFEVLIYLALFMLFLCVPTLFAGLHLIDRRAKREALIACPHCKRLLFASPPRAWTIATHRCFYCKKQMFSETDEIDEGRLTAEQLDSAQKSFFRRHLLNLGHFILLAIGSLIILVFGCFADFWIRCLEKYLDCESQYFLYMLSLHQVVSAITLPGYRHKELLSLRQACVG
jgi:hypothetical protein